MSFIKKITIKGHKLRLFLFLILIPCFVLAEIGTEDYRKYHSTKSKFKLEKSAEGLNHPWALTFIDKVNVLITEGYIKSCSKTDVDGKPFINVVLKYHIVQTHL